MFFVSSIVLCASHRRKRVTFIITCPITKHHFRISKFESAQCQSSSFYCFCSHMLQVYIPPITALHYIKVFPEFHCNSFQNAGNITLHTTMTTVYLHFAVLCAGCYIFSGCYNCRSVRAIQYLFNDKSGILQ